MNKTSISYFFRLFSISLIIVTLISGTCLQNIMAAGNYSVGDTIEFGFYPQSEVKDSNTISELNNLSLNWNSLNYYDSKGGSYGSMESGDWMQYADVTYNNECYRAIKFNFYRPKNTGLSCEFLGKSAIDATYQDDNGYFPNNIYWFKYEPLTWRIIDPNSGFVICDTIIDSQPFNNEVYENQSEDYNFEHFSDKEFIHYANDYSASSIREWLNNDFLNSAFSPSQQSAIYETELKNQSAPEFYKERFDAQNSTDKIFLVSYEDACNENYGFNANINSSDESRRRKGTDYAKCQGLYVIENTDNHSYWYSRTSRSNAELVCIINYFGKLYENDSYKVNDTAIGIVPALKIDLNYIENIQNESPVFNAEANKQSEYAQTNINEQENKFDNKYDNYSNPDYDEISYEDSSSSHSELFREQAEKTPKENNNSRIVLIVGCIFMIIGISALVFVLSKKK